MTTYRVGVVEQALLDKGMERDENHHHMFRKRIEGVTQLVTRTSHGTREIDDHLGGLMAKQCCLRLREFWELVECPLDQSGWDVLVRGRCAGGRNPFLGR
jgi:hypothetical protein